MATIIKLAEASLEVTDRTGFFVADIKAVLDEDPDCAGFTELWGRHQEFREVCRDNGYQPVMFTRDGQTGEGFAVKNGLDVIDKDSTRNHGENPNHPKKGRFGARYTSWVTFRKGDEQVTVNIAHWITQRDASDLREQVHNQTTKVMGRQMRREGTGRRVVFFMGDVNLDDAKKRDSTAKLFREYGMLTCWDELDKYPNTLGRATYDVIGSWDGDKRVRCTTAKALDKGHSNHVPIVATYRIDEARVKPVHPKGKVPPPDPPYLGPPDKFSAGDNGPYHRIVLHSTVSACEPGMARRICAFFRSEAAQGSAQYVVDPNETFQAAWDSVICWHAPPNPGTIGVELCEHPKSGIGSVLRWRGRNHKKMLQRAAPLVAQLLLAYDIPFTHLSVAQCARNKAGYCDHDCVSKAFGESDHWDVGTFPWDHFAKLLAVEEARLRAKYLL